MEPNQSNPSPENQGIPQGIPTGVFVPNNQVPVQTPVTTNNSPETTTPQIVEGPLDRIFRGLAKFIAKITGQPDPITGAPNVASQALQKGENIVGKVRGAANQVVEKAGDVAGKAVDTATNVATQAAQQVQQIIPPPTAPQTPVQESPVPPVTPPTI
ncbi:MAG TPA: hypothetical protein PKC87_01500 [Candidatus Absconditabacterales bacterium]|nr:hypothetical protein [Candidatus Absconditabacterales bacterium]